MKKIALRDSRLDVDLESYLSQHDVVFQTPVADGYDGIPLGNGDIGIMGWTPPERLHFQINKCNTWDDAPPGGFHAWEDAQDPKKGESFTALRHCAQLTIAPGLPVLDWRYLTDFEARLSLYQAEGSWRASGPLGEMRCDAFVAQKPGVIVIHYEDSLAEPVKRTVLLERWGTRVFEHWYSRIRRANYLGLGPPETAAAANEVWMLQATRSLRFAVACRIADLEVGGHINHSRSAGFEIEAGRTCAFDLYLTVVTSEENPDPVAEARRIVASAAASARGALLETHRKSWHDFWSQSFVQLSDDYLTNLWYLNLYQAGSSSRGTYPPHFISSLWSHERDFRPWNHYYHWNQQQYTWPLHAAGHPELMLPYAKWRLEGLPKARDDARAAHHCNGAFYTDVSDRRGNQDTHGNRKWNLGPGGQIALDMYRHYRYTRDEDFLETYAYPIMNEVVSFFLDYLEEGDDGRYHIPEADPFETTFLHCRDTTNDLAHIRALFPAFADMAEGRGREAEMVARIREVLGRLASYVYAELPEGCEYAGSVKAGAKIIGCGQDLATDTPAHFWVRGPRGAKPGSHTMNAQMAPVFTTGLVGLDDPGTKEFEILRTTLRAVDPIGMHGHIVLPICMARLGFAREMEEVLHRWVDAYQLFAQGFFCYFKRDYEEDHQKGLYHRYSAAHHLIPSLTNTVSVSGSSPEESVDLPKTPFAHMALEAGAVLQTTLNEMLLQSHSGTIRVFPAMPETWEARFTLHAVGGFVVTSEIMNNEVVYVAIESTAGLECCLVAPWENVESTQVQEVGSGEVVEFTRDGERISFATSADHAYLIYSVDASPSACERFRISGTLNGAAKKLRGAILGKDRQF